MIKNAIKKPKWSGPRRDPRVNPVAGDRLSKRMSMSVWSVISVLQDNVVIERDQAVSHVTLYRFREFFRFAEIVFYGDSE